MAKYLIVFLSDGEVAYWIDAEHFDCAQFHREDLPYHDPRLGRGYILTECVEHGWRPAELSTGICEDCWGAYFDNEELSKLDVYHEFEWRQDFHEGGL